MKKVTVILDVQITETFNVEDHKLQALNDDKFYKYHASKLELALFADSVEIIDHKVIVHE